MGIGVGREAGLPVELTAQERKRLGILPNNSQRPSGQKERDLRACGCTSLRLLGGPTEHEGRGRQWPESIR